MTRWRIYRYLHLTMGHSRAAAWRVSGIYARQRRLR